MRRGGARDRGLATKGGSLRLDDWFLTIDERGNPATAIDRRHADGLSWTEGNRVEVFVDGAGGEIILDERVRRGGSHSRPRSDAITPAA